MIGVYLPAPTRSAHMVQWEFALSHWQPDRLFTTSPDGFRNLDVTRVSSYDDVEWDGPRVLLAPPSGRYISGDIPLDEYDHPETVLYVFGPDGEHQPPVEVDARVFIPTDTKDEMWSWVAWAVTMWDRRYG